MKRIVLTGGGTAGHVTPNIALIPKLKELGYEIHYIGSKDGIEKKLIEELGIPYYGISSGKLRRYFDVKNFTDPFHVMKGFFEAKTLLKKLKPNVVFSKGGFVTVPVVYAANRCKIPAVIHESDLTPGLANRLCIKKATKVCANFPETINYLPENKAVLTGSPIRKELFTGSKLKGLDFCNFTANKPVILVTGGSLGSVAVNNAIRNLLPTLLRDYQVIHLCGKGKLASELDKTPGYVQYEYIKEELSDLFAASDLIISRAGANTICEILAMRKPNILVPLSAASSRGDQILNAESFQSQGFSYVVKEEELSNETLLDAIQHVTKHKEEYTQAMNQSSQNNAVETIVSLIDEVSIKSM